MAGRSPHGERGLKSGTFATHVPNLGRSPHGERGLKSEWRSGRRQGGKSLSSRRAWIEITCPRLRGRIRSVALLTESVD